MELVTRLATCVNTSIKHGRKIVTDNGRLRDDRFNNARAVAFRFGDPRKARSPNDYTIEEIN